jgi:hypothetical protein
MDAKGGRGSHIICIYEYLYIYVVFYTEYVLPCAAYLIKCVFVARGARRAEGEARPEEKIGKGKREGGGHRERKRGREGGRCCSTDSGGGDLRERWKDKGAEGEGGTG